MALAPVHRLSKTEIVKLAGWKCPHSHTGLDHFACWQAANPETQERIGFYDLECTNLKADFGHLLSWCIRDSFHQVGKDGIEYDVITLADIEKAKDGDEDKRIVQSFVNAIQKYDRLCGHYAARFDAKFIRTRAVITGVEFPEWGQKKHTDTYDLIKRKFLLSSNRLENACRQLLGSTEKTHLDGRIWRRAGRGSKKDLAYILDHNVKDCMDLEKIFNKVVKYSRLTDTSI